MVAVNAEPTLFLIVLLTIVVVGVGVFAWGFIPDLFSALPILAVVGVVLIGALVLVPTTRQFDVSSSSAATPHWQDLRERRWMHAQRLSDQRRADRELVETISKRWEEADNLNEQFVADVHSDAE